MYVDDAAAAAKMHDRNEDRRNVFARIEFPYRIKHNYIVLRYRAAIHYIFYSVTCMNEQSRGVKIDIAHLRGVTSNLQASETSEIFFSPESCVM